MMHTPFFISSVLLIFCCGTSIIAINHDIIVTEDSHSTLKHSIADTTEFDSKVVAVRCQNQSCPSTNIILKHVILHDIVFPSLSVSK